MDNRKRRLYTSDGWTKTLRVIRMPIETRRGHHSYSAEPILFLVAFATLLSETPLQDLFLRKVCIDMKDIPNEWCGSLPSHPEAEVKVQPRAAVLLMAKTLMETVFPAVAAFWIGPWSDRTRRRKPLLIIPLTGFALMYSLLAILSSIPSLPAEFLLFASLPAGFCGGLVTVFTAVMCIVADETEGDGKLRTLRLGFLQAAFVLGVLPGSLSSSYLLLLIDYSGIFLISAGASFVGLLIAIFVGRDSPDALTGPEAGTVFDMSLAKEMFETVSRRRPKGQRSIILLCSFSLAITVLTFEGEAGLNFLFVRDNFAWTIKEYTIYVSVSILITVIGTIFGVTVLSTVLKIPDAPLTTFIFFTKVVASMIKAFATKSWLFYLSSVTACISGASSPITRSIISKSVPQEDLGKVFSLTTSLEALTPLAAAPLYTLIFNKTLRSFSGAIFLLTAAINFMDTLLIGAVSLIQLKYSREEAEPLQNEEESIPEQ